MDKVTHDALTTRLLNLEFQLQSTDSPNQSHDSIMNQLSQIQSHLNTLYNSNPELVSLNKIISDHQLWDKLDSSSSTLQSTRLISPPKSQSQPQSQPQSRPQSQPQPQPQASIKTDQESQSENESRKDNLSLSAKQQIILLKYPEIKIMLNMLNELSNFEPMRITNYYDSSQIKNHNFTNDKIKILLRRQEIEKIAKNYHKLVIKNMIIFEKRVDLLLKQNNYWITIDEKVAELEKKVGKYELIERTQNKY